MSSTQIVTDCCVQQTESAKQKALSAYRDGLSITSDATSIRASAPFSLSACAAVARERRAESRSRRDGCATQLNFFACAAVAHEKSIVEHHQVGNQP